MATRLERSQQSRRARAIAAVLELAEQEGYDAVQIRAVAERSDVSSDTLYRYFGSRDGLISAALIDWLERESFGLLPSWLEGETPAERLLTGLCQQWAGWEAHPNMLETFTRATLAQGHRPDGPAALAMKTVMSMLSDVLRDVDPGYRDDLLMMLEHFTHALMNSVVHGFRSIEEVQPLVERFIRRLAQHPAMADHRPPSWGWPQG